MKSIGRVIGCQTFITGDNITFNVLPNLSDFFHGTKKAMIEGVTLLTAFEIHRGH